MSLSLTEEFRDSAKEAPEGVSVDISYRIIKQVSSQLYTNPRRAIEELVCNSYDAEAEQCYVNTPSSTDDALMVLDDGESMDLEGLQWLWTVAESPKTKGNGERVNKKRKQIGKFGVGKLAAYSLGDRLTHVAHKDGTTRLVTVSESGLQSKAGDEDGSPDYPVHELSEDEAREVLSPYFEDLPNPYEEGWESWTLALVEELHEDSSGQSLKAQYLDHMIRTSIPVAADFSIYRDGKVIDERKIDSDPIFKTDVTSESFLDWFEDDLRSFWAKRQSIDKDDVDEDKFSCEVGETERHSDTEETVDALFVPELGPVVGDATIYEGTLTKGKREERGFQDHGFKVTVKGKHLNRHDPLFGISQRSHKYWNRFLAKIEVPGLDKAILVQRNDVNDNKIETIITRRLLKSIFNYARVQAEEREESEDYEPKSFGERLSIYSPFEAAEAIEGLTGEYPSDDLGEIDVMSSSQNAEDKPVIYQDGKMYINEEHPFFQALSEERNYSNFKKPISESVAGSLLTSGYLNKKGVPEEILEEADEIFDDVLRSAASYYRDETQYLIKTIEEASYEGDDPFERAIISAFRTMKIAARHYGASADPDGIIEIPRAGSKNLRVSIEAKGKIDGKTVDHTDAAPSTVARQRDTKNCDHAVIIGREFQIDGQEADSESVFLQEVQREENVSLLDVPALTKLLSLHKERRFGYSQIRKILTEYNHPDDLEDHIERVWEEKPDADLFRVILDAAWELQQNTEVRPSSGAISAKPRVQEVTTDREEIAEIIRSLSYLTGEKVNVYDEGHEFELEASPAAILEELADQNTGGREAQLSEFKTSE